MGWAEGAAGVERLLDNILRARVLSGELPAAAVPLYADDELGPADPARDWYQTPLLRSGR